MEPKQRPCETSPLRKQQRLSYNNWVQFSKHIDLEIQRLGYPAASKDQTFNMPESLM